MNEPKSQDVSMRELLVFFYRYRARLILAFLVPFCLVFIFSFIPSPRYEASSVLIVRLGSEYVYQPEVTNNHNGPESALPFDRDQIFKSEVAILGSDDLHDQVMKTIGLDRLYPDIAEPNFFTSAIRYMNDGLAAIGLADPVTDEQWNRQRLAKALIRFDKRLDIELEKESAVITVTFRHTDAALAVQVLDTLLQLYMEKRKQLYMEPRVELAQTQVEATHQKALVAEQSIEKFKHDHRIYSLPDQRTSLLQARSEVEKEQATVSSPALAEKLGFFNNQLDRLDAQERELDRLQHERQIAEDEYALASHKLNEAKAFDDLERERVGSVRIIQPPTAPAEPKPLQLLIILAGLFISVVSVLAMAAMTEFVECGFLTPERLERRIGVPVLGVLSWRK